MYDNVNNVDELIEMLEIVKNQIKPHLSPKNMTTVIEDIYPESVDFVLKEAIRYLHITKEIEEHEKNPYTV